MGVLDACLKPLGPRRIVVVFCTAVLLFVYPIVQADYPYGDDVPRGLLLGEELWKTQGRWFMQLFQTVASFNSHSINVFPLPLLMMLPVLVFALVALSRHYFPNPCLLDCQVVLPLLYSPFFLGNLSYQYDGPMMVLALSCVIYAITLRAKRACWRVCMSGVLLAVAAGLYQITLQVFVSLCCVECVRYISEGRALRPILLALMERVVQLLAGGLLYYFSAFQFYASWRGAMAQPDSGWVELLKLRAIAVTKVLGLFVNDGNRWLFIASISLAAVGLGLTLLVVFGTRHSPSQRLGLVLLCATALLLIAVCVPGAILIIQDFALNSRSLMAFSCVMVLVFYLARIALSAVHPLLNALLIIPLLCMLSFAFAYGRVLVAQKAFETRVVYSVAYDLSSRPQLHDIQDFYLIAPEHLQVWLPAAAAVTAQMPGLEFILDLKQVTSAERLVMAGITNVGSRQRSEFVQASRGGEAQLLVANTFYDIVRLNGTGYILLKTPEGPSQYKYHW